VAVQDVTSDLIILQELVGGQGVNGSLQIQIFVCDKLSNNDALAEWLRRVPAKYMGFPRESSNLSGVVPLFLVLLPYSLLFSLPVVQLHQKQPSSLSTFISFSFLPFYQSFIFPPCGQTASDAFSRLL
jgi:hypothetical protein